MRIFALELNNDIKGITHREGISALLFVMMQSESIFMRM